MRRLSLRVSTFLSLLAAAACGRSTLLVDPLPGSSSGAGGQGGAGPASSASSTAIASSSASSTASSSANVSSSSAIASSSSGVVAFCGDGNVDPGEECDDGNQINDDACVNCKKARCGDGFVETGVEECDDGNTVDTDSCTGACKKARCGDGFVETGVEQCDDGNTVDTDGCHNDCQLPSCGDGTVDPGEQCDLGGANADRPALQLSQGALVLRVPPLDGAESAVAFYGYSSMSGHTGFEQVGRAEMFFFRSTLDGTLSLVIEQGIDFDTSMQNQPAAHTILDLTGLPPATTVALSDDPGELTKPINNWAHGDWTFNQNADGGVLSGFPLPGTWQVTVHAQLLQGITDWVYVMKDGTTVALQPGAQVVLTAFGSPSACRTNCSAPSCGDGILDGGEGCDDGNNVGGDGCAADCKSLQ